ncbi:VCBS repeat-containing protein [Maribacter sp. 2304DJ31-5]|uniref:VCBS repeat-containing protein n=1 Tax=Maribacter sp. 2304DJ31-5 TaxID=3386273 RepID=UPI0039BCC42F
MKLLPTNLNWFKKSYNPPYLFITGIVLLFISCAEKKITLFEEKEPYESGIRFTNKVEEKPGFDLTSYYYVYNGGGVAIGDVNNDGLDDIYFTGNMVSSALYLNKGNLKFEDITSKSGTATTNWSSGATMVDINGDSLLDIYVSKAGNHTSQERENLLFINQGVDEEGIPLFKELAEQYGVNDDGYTTHAAFFDYDKDGDLDLYLLNHSMSDRIPDRIRPMITDGSGSSNDQLYQNNGNGNFIKVTEQAGIVYEGMGLGLAISDINQDGWDDVYVSNDFISHDYLYINNQDGTFTESGDKYFKHFSHFGMGNDIADINNDGKMEIIVADMLPYENWRRHKMVGDIGYTKFKLALEKGYRPQYMRNTLQLNNGPNTEGAISFSEIGQFSGIHTTDWSWAPLLADYDNDGYRDLFITNGYKRFLTDMDFIAYGIVDKEPNPIDSDSAVIALSHRLQNIKLHNFIFKNKGDLTFEDKSENWGFTNPSLSNGAAYSDLDNDGDLDLAINNLDAPANIYENKSDQLFKNHYLRITLKGPDNNASGLGAEIRIYYDGMMQSHYQQHVRGFQSSIDQKLHFGLGNSEKIDSVIVNWPDGMVSKSTMVDADQILVVNHKNANKNIELSTKNTPPNTCLNKVDLVDHTHHEPDYLDFNRDFLIPQKLSEQGPRLAAGDINNDGLDDFFVGGNGDEPGSIYLQKQNGSFYKQSTLEKPIPSEDIEATFFDADNDGDLDIYVVSGSNEYQHKENYLDRLYFNDGKGNFTLTSGHLPDIPFSGSCVMASDFDRDGDLDLFIGARVHPTEYPKPVTSLLLVNNAGYFSNYDFKNSRGLIALGMVTDAVWTDFNNDDYPDLVVVGEYMPVTFFENKKGTLVDVTHESGTKNLSGWWNSISSADFDNDGDMDFIVGNLGLNSSYKASLEEPITLYANDFDSNGKIDPLISHYLEGEEHLVHNRDQFVNQIRKGKNIFPTYDSYAHMKVSQLFTEKDLKEMLVLQANCLQSMYIENIGNNKFKAVPLPKEAQWAPIMDLLADDVNNDGLTDVLLVGNNYGIEPVAGRHDAFTGLLMLGKGDGNFDPLSIQESGFYVDGDARSIVKLKSKLGTTYMVSQNSASIKTFQKK